MTPFTPCIVFQVTMRGWQKWLSQFPNIEWTYVKSGRLCSKHFRPEDYKSESSDSNSRRTSDAKKVTKRLLKKGAFPTIWPNVPTNLLRTSCQPLRQTTRTNAACRRDIADAIEKVRAEKHRVVDQLKTLDDLKDENLFLPSNCSTFMNTDSFVILKTDLVI